MTVMATVGGIRFAGAEALLEAGAPELAARGVALPDALGEIWMYLERARPL